MSERLKSCTFVIPYRDQPESLHQCLTALSELDTSAWDKVEVSVVDNGSKKWSINHWRDKFPNVRFLEYTGGANPYSCRNLGISEATSEWIGLLDAQCLVSRDWLVRALVSIDEGYDMIAGLFLLDYPDNRISSKVHGVLYLLNQRNWESKRGYPGGNLLIRKSLFDRWGMFDSNFNSGSDIIWTKDIIEHGETHIYNRDMVVRYPSKTFRELLTSMKKYARAVSQRMSIVDRATTFFRSLFPLRPSVFYRAIKERNLCGLSYYDHIQLYLYTWLAKIYYGFCIIVPSSSVDRKI